MLASNEWRGTQFRVFIGRRGRERSATFARFSAEYTAGKGARRFNWPQGDKVSRVIFATAESARDFIQSITISGERFDLAIKDEMTFGGEPDVIGAGMALILDAILAQGYAPDGREQCNGHSIYRYKLMG